MNVSVFFLAAAADSIVHAFNRFVRARTMMLRPSSVLIAVSLLLGTLCYWTFRSIDSAAEKLEVADENQISLNARREQRFE